MGLWIVPSQRQCITILHVCLPSLGAASQKECEQSNTKRFSFFDCTQSAQRAFAYLFDRNLDDTIAL